MYMANMAASARPDIMAGIRPLKSMSVQAIFLPMALPSASVSAMSKPVRCPSMVISMGGKGGSVPLRIVSDTARPAESKPVQAKVSREGGRGLHTILGLSFVGVWRSGVECSDGGGGGRERGC